MNKASVAFCYSPNLPRTWQRWRL